MKTLSVFIIILLVVLSSSGNYCLPPHKYLPPPTTLDSLQGDWINEKDSLHTVKITGRYWTEEYLNQSHPYLEIYIIYFSDTVVNNELLFNQISIDTAALTGNYLILKSSFDETLDCSFITGFYRDNVDTTFSIMPPNGRLENVQVFKKTN